ncbi:MAG: DUF4276 family protein [Burkholderiales bacterium]|nr:DUF4276 family protein [Burkholderiales bacterium]
MKYLGLALYSEGRTDDYFLRPLLLRLCDHLCLTEGQEPVDVSDVVPLADAPDTAGAPRDARILAAAQRHRGAWQVLFVHGDGEADPGVARTDRVQPGIDAVHAVFGEDGFAVAVIPVRETEAWALHDSAALRTVLNTNLDDQQLGLPVGARAIEGAQDPKRILEGAFLATKPSGQRRRKGVAPLLASIGEQVDLARLGELPSFGRLKDELRMALRSLHVIA